jgi:DNA methyltransferase 1-associated protein 1
MPTERVCKDFEKLIQSVNLLLDARKVAEKVESEIRVLEAARAERERKNAPEGSSKDTEHPEVKTEADDGGNSMLGSTAADATESGAPAGGEGQAKGDGASSQTPVKEDGNHKRSASVLSSVSDKSSKRQRR